MIRQRYLVAAMALAALGIAVAPQATAAPGQTCTNNGGATVCTRPGGSTSINATPPVVGPYNDCGYGVGMEYMCDGGISWNIGGIFRRN